MDEMTGLRVVCQLQISTITTITKDAGICIEKEPTHVGAGGVVLAGGLEQIEELECEDCTSSPADSFELAGDTGDPHCTAACSVFVPASEDDRGLVDGSFEGEGEELSPADASDAAASDV